jgi:hypothetical protein
MIFPNSFDTFQRSLIPPPGEPPSGLALAVAFIQLPRTSPTGFRRHPARRRSLSGHAVPVNTPAAPDGSSTAPPPLRGCEGRRAGSRHRPLGAAPAKFGKIPAKFGKKHRRSGGFNVPA